MKSLPLILAALALSVPVVQAKVYNITLTNATTYTQCHIKYRGDTTKFIGLDKKGQQQTVEVPSIRILTMREVEEKQPEPEPAAAPEPTPAPAPAPAAEPQAEQEEATSEMAENKSDENAPAAEGQPAPAEAAPAEVDDAQAQNVTLHLREKLATLDAEFASLRSPSKGITNRVDFTRKRIVKSLDLLDKQSLKVAELQRAFNRAGRGDFTFTHVTEEQRTQYEREGEAAYKAMLIDMKEKPGARKVGGIDKFEIMRERYQGIPQYKDAYEWYIKTLKSLEKKWAKMIEKEENRRKSAQPAKKMAMNQADDAEFDKLKDSFESEGEKFASVWFNPRPRNMAMLKFAHDKVRDALRRNSDTTLPEAVGTVPGLLKQTWEAMDKARQLMLAGQLDQAEDVIKKDAAFEMLSNLNKSIFPQDYSEPVKLQHKAIEKEILSRRRNVTSAMSKLEHAASELQRSTGSAEAQINALLEDIQREKNLDAGENTVAMETSMNEPDEDEENAEGAAEEAADDAGEAPATDESEKQ